MLLLLHTAFKKKYWGANSICYYLQ